MKRFLKISAAALAIGMAATLAGCAGCSSCAGCSGNTINSTVINSNWFTGTSYKGIQPSFIKDDAHPEYSPEIIVYDVALDSTFATNSSYYVEYKDGTFTTEFYATYYDWNDSIDEYKSEDPAANVKELVYCYKMNYRISVRYGLKVKEGEEKVETDWFEDSMVTECYFRAASRALQPVYSKQQIRSTSPAVIRTDKLEETYERTETVYENYYSRDCSQVITLTAEGNKEAEKQTPVSFNKVKNTLFDNSSLYIAIRGMNLDSSFSQTVSLFAPAAGGVSDYNISGTAFGLGKEERKSISAALADKGLYVPKDPTVDSDGNTVEDEGINAVAMNVNYTGGKLTGTTQTVWYAKVENADNNTARATMLKLSIPLSYGLGTLNFTLKEVTETLWTDVNK